MRIFVTGGNGFIGSVVVRELARRGHGIVCLLRKTSRTERIDAVPHARVYADVCDADAVRDGMRACDATIHLAAPGGWTADDPAELRRIIAGGTRTVLDAAESIRGHRVVHVSSTAAINGSERPRIFDERAPFTLRDPVLHYAHAKHEAERIAARAHERGVPVVIVNPAEVYGPGDDALGTAANLIDFVTAKPVLVCRGGTSVVHVDDVAASIIRALERGRPGERYILGGDNITIHEMARVVLELVGRRATLITVPRRLARSVARAALRWRIPLPYEPAVVPYATRYWFVDNSKARRELGVSFRGARETIASTLAWLRERRLI
jgi:dihydroflavonol-4-reductase